MPPGVLLSGGGRAVWAPSTFGSLSDVVRPARHPDPPMGTGMVMRHVATDVARPARHPDPPPAALDVRWVLGNRPPVHLGRRQPVCGGDGLHGGGGGWSRHCRPCSGIPATWTDPVAAVRMAVPGRTDRSRPHARQQGGAPLRRPADWSACRPAATVLWLGAGAALSLSLPPPSERIRQPTLMAD